MYVVTEGAEQSLKDLVRIINRYRYTNPSVVYFLNKWNIISLNLIPILITQWENKTIVYNTLLILQFLCEIPNMKDELFINYKLT